MNIITVTLNPAIDMHVSCPALEIGKSNGVSTLRRDSGGKGINVSRALRSLGGESVCYALVGRDNAEELLGGLVDMDIMHDLIDGRVRTNVNIHTDGTDTVLSSDGPMISKEDMERVEKRVLPAVSDGSFFVLSGSLPRGMDKRLVISLLLKARSRGARLVVDCRDIGAEELCELRPYLIKPNREELKELTGIDCASLAELVRALPSALSSLAENTVVTLGRDGAVLYNGREVYLATVPDVSVLSTTGAGDSAIAGVLLALCRGEDLPRALRLGAAASVASCLREGTLPPTLENTLKLYDEIDVIKIEI